MAGQVELQNQLAEVAQELVEEHNWTKADLIREIEDVVSE